MKWQLITNETIGLVMMIIGLVAIPVVLIWPIKVKVKEHYFPSPIHEEAKELKRIAENLQELANPLRGFPTREVEKWKWPWQK